MKKTLFKIGSVGAVALLMAAPASAQNVNGSDFPIPLAALSGQYSPANYLSAINTLSAALSSGSVVSTVTGAAVPQAIGQAVLALLSGSSGAVQAVQDALNAAGGPAQEIAALMKAMNGAGGEGAKTLSRAEIVNMTTAFNNMINASSPAFLATTNGMLVGIQATLTNIINLAGTK